MWRRVQQHRRGQDIEEAQDTGLDADDVPDDAMVALELLRAQFPQSDVVGVRPVILVSQLYSLVKDRTTVDRQLDKAMRLQEIRLFRWVRVSLPRPAVCLDAGLVLMEPRRGRMVGHATDNLAMAADDYEAAARRAVEVYASKRKSGSRSSGAGKHARREISHGRAFGADSGSDEDEDVQGFGRATGRNDSGDCVAGPGKGEILERFLYGVLPEHPRVSISAFDLTGSIAAARCAPEGASSSQGNQTNTAQAGVAASGIKSAWNRGALRQLSASESQVTLLQCDSSYRFAATACATDNDGAIYPCDLCRMR